MRKIIFAAFDDPHVVNFFRSGISMENRPDIGITAMQDFPLIYLDMALSNGMLVKKIGCITASEMLLRESLEAYTRRLITEAICKCNDTGCQTILCFLPYPEFIEMQFTQVSHEVADADFFEEHVYYNSNIKERGKLWEIMPMQNSPKTVVHLLAQEELFFLPVAN